MADEVDVRLAKMRMAMGRMLRAGRQKEFDALAAEYATLKREQMEGAEEEHRSAARARRVERERERVASARVDEAARWRRVIRGRYGAGPTSVIWRPESRRW